MNKGPGTPKTGLKRASMRGRAVSALAVKGVGLDVPQTQGPHVVKAFGGVVVYRDEAEGAEEKRQRKEADAPHLPSGHVEA